MENKCLDKRCPAALCAVCREEADVLEHVLLRGPALAGARQSRTHRSTDICGPGVSAFRPDGTVGGSPNYFSVQGLLGLFWAVVNFFQLFFRTLISPDDNKRGRSYTSDYRAPGQGGGGGGGGGGWGGGGPGGPPRGMPRRRMGGFSTGQGAAGAPPMAGGG
ncbi:hypothetical protein FJT64_005431 [Amphibalanus amphitrite]|uniref:Selenoprotein K n=1 Tax=Amphibalanus amphitrite TaxID=1232801 RepID=A0A6A4W229_AMPAM|nr:hypothetical protein FJT64_005431 [Amphibalanus amphitrite]